MEERYKNEFFTVLRTIQRILIGEKEVSGNFTIKQE
jgi:hypothetical protein